MGSKCKQTRMHYRRNHVVLTFPGEMGLEDGAGRGWGGGLTGEVPY